MDLTDAATFLYADLMQLDMQNNREVHFDDVGRLYMSNEKEAAVDNMSTSTATLEVTGGEDKNSAMNYDLTTG